MAADQATLDEMATLLLRRADDLHAVGRALVDDADTATWRCAKADRYRMAMQARSTETLRVAVLLRDSVGSCAPRPRPRGPWRHRGAER